MNVNLSPVFEEYIKQQLDTGMYNNASEVIREALRLKMQQDEVYQARLHALRTAIDDGFNSGESIPLDMSSIIADAKAKAEVDA
ncbi:CopG family transcriptional regulator [Pseudoalteromonas sp. A25]|uniref:type II toxin-antitoxin system ParD family antitoxin n=1 Tax=Pseudoalteromonas sp. A25 TaxID=116092 RepID=UPI0012613443|nr:type II toxin-antitoxin system ParD family antitoxin [Pseudoalteromonas sp. A25]BBN82108.1 CopG family transcriptional regulator [Pseudoalteromonas sp. A25]